MSSWRAQGHYEQWETEDDLARLAADGRCQLDMRSYIKILVQFYKTTNHLWLIQWIITEPRKTVGQGILYR
jgi:hypothetical protein